MKSFNSFLDNIFAHITAFLWVISTGGAYDPDTKKKILKFKPHIVQQILSGQKDSTWRLFDDKNLKQGDELLLVNQDTGEIFGKAIITSTREKKLGELQDSDFEGHGRYESEEKMYEAYRGYYGDKVTPESMVKIIKFKLEN